MSRIQDYMNNPWYREMYKRYSVHDPSNRNYGTYDNAGINTPLTIASNPNFAIQMKRYQNGVDKYSVGGISKEGVMLQSQLNACSSATGMPTGCATKLGLGSNYSPASVTYRNVYNA